jgi:hypothetical protein
MNDMIPTDAAYQEFYCLGCEQAYPDMDTLRNHPACPAPWFESPTAKREAATAA